MTKLTELRKKMLRNPKVKAAYDALGEEFELTEALIRARTRAGLTQSQLAKKMHTSQPYIAKLESGEVKPTTQALERFAAATGSRLRISIEPKDAR